MDRQRFQQWQQPADDARWSIGDQRNRGGICYISPGMVSVQAPSPLSGTVSVQLTHNGVVSNTVTATALSNAPSIFVYNAGSKVYPSALYPNGLIVGDPSLSGTIVAKAKTNDVIQLFVNAVGSSASGIIIDTVVPYSAPLTVTIGGVNAPVQFAGLVVTGEFQINVMVPSLPSGDQPIVITTAGQSSQSGVMIPIQ